MGSGEWGMGVLTKIKIKNGERKGAKGKSGDATFTVRIDSV